MGTPNHDLGEDRPRLANVATRAHHGLMRARSQLFTYQYLYRLERA